VRIPYADMSLVKIPDSLTDEDVLFVGDILSTAYFALENVPIHPGDTVVIVGPGPVGLAVQELVPVFGAGTIIMIGTREYRMEVSKQRGAITINPNKENAPEMVLELTNGYGADVVVECVGTPEAFQIAFDCVRKGGAVSLMGMWGEPVEVPLNDMVMNNITIFTGLVNCHRIQEIVDLIECGRINANWFRARPERFCNRRHSAAIPRIAKKRKRSPGPKDAVSGRTLNRIYRAGLQRPY
jgi:alcohol dehydrogenase